MKKFDVIYADPPWRYRAWSGDKGSRTAESFYSTMAPDELTAMRDQLDTLSADNCALFLWATSPLLPVAIKLIDDWGFTYKTVAFDWIKMTRKGLPHFGMSHYTRGAPELCLLGMRGRMPVSDRSIRACVTTEIREHSRKPDEIRALIERLYPDKSYVELFARGPSDGWTAWGNESEIKDFRPRKRRVA